MIIINRRGPWEGYRRLTKRVSPVVSFPPSFARTFSLKERRLGTRQLQLRLWNLNSTSNSPVAPRRMSCQIIPSCGHTTDFLPGLKLDLLAVYLRKLLSVTDFSLGNLPRGNFIVWGLDMSREQ